MKFLIQTAFGVFAFFQLLCLEAQSISCSKFLKNQIFVGAEVNVRLETMSLLGRNSHWVAGVEKNLIYIGRIYKGESLNEDILFFIDTELNAYYLKAFEISINRQPVKFFITKESFLTPVLHQTEGSCSLCSQVTALNQLAIDRGLEPIKLSDKELMDYFSNFNGEDHVRDFSRAALEDSSHKGTGKEMEKSISNVKWLNRHTLSDLPNKDFPFPLEVQGQFTTNKKLFVRHMKDGGTAIVMGSVSEAWKSVVSKDYGYLIKSEPGAVLVPTPGKLARIFMMMKLAPKILGVVKEFSKQRKRGIETPPEVVEDAIMELLLMHVANPLLRGGSPHAMAAIKIIEEGPFKDHIVVANSWGTYEIYPLSDFRRRMRYLLISPREE